MRRTKSPERKKSPRRGSPERKKSPKKMNKKPHTIAISDFQGENLEYTAKITNLTKINNFTCERLEIALDRVDNSIITCEIVEDNEIKGANCTVKEIVFNDSELNIFRDKSIELYKNHERSILSRHFRENLIKNQTGMPLDFQSTLNISFHIDETLDIVGILVNPITRDIMVLLRNSDNILIYSRTTGELIREIGGFRKFDIIGFCSDLENIYLATSIAENENKIKVYKYNYNMELEKVKTINYEKCGAEFSNLLSYCTMNEYLYLYTLERFIILDSQLNIVMIVKVPDIIISSGFFSPDSWGNIICFQEDVGYYINIETKTFHPFNYFIGNYFYYMGCITQMSTQGVVYVKYYSLDTRSQVGNQERIGILNFVSE